VHSTFLWCCLYFRFYKSVIYVGDRSNHFLLSSFQLHKTNLEVFANILLHIFPQLSTGSSDERYAYRQQAQCVNWRIPWAKHVYVQGSVHVRKFHDKAWNYVIKTSQNIYDATDRSVKGRRCCSNSKQQRQSFMGNNGTWLCLLGLKCIETNQWAWKREDSVHHIRVNADLLYNFAVNTSKH
jgi:hypothetical protein